MSDEFESIRIRLQFEADQAEKAANRMERQLLSLEGRYDPLARATKYLERDQKLLNAALEAGKIDAARHAAMMDNVQREYAATEVQAQRLAGALNADTVAVSRLNAVLGSNQTRMFGMQMSQMVQQTMAGGDALRSIAIQLPDIGLAFGTAGIAVGAVAGLLLPVAANLFGAGDAAEDAGKGVELFTDALSNYEHYASVAGSTTQELQTRFGKFADDVRAQAEGMAKVTASAAVSQLTASDFMGGLEGISATIAELDRLQEVYVRNQQLLDQGLGDPAQISASADAVEVFRIEAEEAAKALGLNLEQARQLVPMLDAIGTGGMADIATAAARASDQIMKMYDGAAVIPAPIQKLLELLAAVAPAAAAAASSAEEIANGFTKATKSANEMLAALNDEMRLQIAIRDHGADSAVVAQMRADAERDAYFAAVDALGVSQEQSDTIKGAYLVTTDLVSANEAVADRAARAAQATSGLSGNIAQASVFAAQLVSVLGQVPSAVAAIGSQVDSAISTLQNQNTSLTRQLERGITASAAGVLQLRDDAIKAAAATGATADQLAALGQEFDAQAAKADGLARENTGLSKTLSDQAAAAAKAAKAIGGGGSKKGLSDASKAASAAMKAAERDAEALRKEIERLEFDADPVKKYNAELEHLGDLSKEGLSGGAYAEAVEQLNDELARSYPLIGDVSDAFGDFVAGGLQDFKGFVKSILGSFTGMISKMIATAARNRIMLSMGIGGGGLAGTAASAASGGLGGLGGMGGMLGGIGSRIGAMGSVFASNAMASLSTFATGGIGAGLSGIGASLGAATTGMAGMAAAAGSLVPVIGAVALGISFFKSKTKELDNGIRLTIEGNDLLAESYRKVQKSRFWGLTKSTSTGMTAIEDSPMTAAYAAIYAGAADAAKSLDVSTRSLRNYTAQIDISTKDMDEAQAQQAALDALKQAQNDLARRFLKSLGKGAWQLVNSGEELGDVMARVSASVDFTKDAFHGLRASIDLVGLQGAKTATKFVEALGGLQNASTSMSSYVDAIYSDADKMKLARRSLMQSAGAAGIDNIPKSIEDFKRRVDKALANGNTTRAAKLISLAPQFAQWKDLQEAVRGVSKDAGEAAVDLTAFRNERMSLYQQIWTLTGNTAALRKQELAALDPANRALQLRIYALQDSAVAEQKAAAILSERSNLEGTLLGLQGRTAEIRRRELAALDPSNRAIQLRIYALNDAAAAEQKAASILSERMGIQRQIWELTGNEEALRADTLKGLDASNQALQKQFWALSDRKKVEEELAAAAEEATRRLQEMMDAIDPANFGSRFDYQNAVGMASRGLTASRTTPTGVSLVPVPAVAAPAQINTDLAAEIRGLRAEIKAMKDATVNLGVNTYNEMRATRLNSDFAKVEGVKIRGVVKTSAA
ncbi:hypothetical protein SAMN05444339_11040 [Loktanella atrilutea]|uniref:Prophage tail length tape measure protein n=1 Tax=Loktanella atrilutea TaxID=366533 RepID=A0A1M5DKT1_LOKAT|nr:hypothetical protein [Loktanella atrilutea]SHF67628.1 hypothetical protein SAMN05444339_11040 [Loktanella atrilutea]